MPDLFVRHVDGLIVERVRMLAKQRQCSINEVLLHALRRGLGIGAGDQVFAQDLVDQETRAAAGDSWDAAESAAFAEALGALSITRPTTLASGREA